MRKLVTIRHVDAIEPIQNADAIELAIFGGWKVVIKKGEFKVGDPALYFEIDSFLPAGNPAWQFLIDKQSREFDGKTGHRLRTIKLRGQISQGLALRVDQFPVVMHCIRNDIIGGEVLEGPEQAVVYRTLADAMHNSEMLLAPEDLDWSELLGVVKYDPPLPAALQGKAAGLFPSFIRKTDQERCQNLVPEIFQYEKTMMATELTEEQAAAGVAAGRLHIENGIVYTVHEAKADPDAEYEVSIKLDGSSATFFYKRDEGKLGVCSRNLELKVDEENKENTFVRMLFDSGLDVVLRDLDMNIALQGELMGPAIQGNREGLKDFKFFLFDVQLLDEGRYMTPEERHALFHRLLDLGVNSTKIDHVPVLHRAVTLQELGITNAQQLLAYAEGPSLVHAVREGLVFKRVDGGFSFKAISNKFLAAEKD